MFVRIGPFTLLKVLDAYVDGHGITRFPRTADVGPQIDQGSLHAMLVETLLCPSSWAKVPGLSWEEVDETSARMLVPFGGGTERATVRFHPRDGHPTAYETPRFKGAGGPKVGWRVDMLDWWRFGRVVAPRRIAVTWADEPGPWLRERFVKITTGEGIDEPLQRARAAIATARGRPVG